MGAPSPIYSERRLDSWKEIAAFFGRDERTVRRWEKENALPVHRVPGGAKGRVFAYETELHAWLSTPQAVNPNNQRSENDPRIPIHHPSRSYLPARWVLMLGLCAVATAGIISYRNVHRFAANAASAIDSQSSVLEAQDFYLKGRYYWNKRTPDGLGKAVDYFTQAIVRDPNYAQAYVGLAESYNLLREYTGMPDSEAYPRAMAAARKAVELDDHSSEAHAALAFALFYGNWDASDADREFRRAIELDPNNAVAHHWYATYLMTVERLPESLAEIDRARALDPSCAAILADKALILLQQDRDEEGVSLLKQLEASESSFLSPHRYLKEFYLNRGDYANFLIESKAFASLSQNRSALAVVNAAEEGFATGGPREMLESILLAQKRLYADGLITPCELAHTYARLGNKEEALRLLNIAVGQHDGSLLFIGNSPEFESLKTDSAYRSVVSRVGLPLVN